MMVGEVKVKQGPLWDLLVAGKRCSRRGWGLVGKGLGSSVVGLGRGRSRGHVGHHHHYYSRLGGGGGMGFSK